MQAISKTEMHSVAGGDMIDPWGNRYHGVLPDDPNIQVFPCSCDDGKHYGTPGTPNYAPVA